MKEKRTGKQKAPSHDILQKGEIVIQRLSLRYRVSRRSTAASVCENLSFSRTQNLHYTTLRMRAKGTLPES